MRKKQERIHLSFTKPENWFLFLGLLFGLLFALLTPPFQVPDEQAHFFTAYAVSQGQSRHADAAIPVAYVDMWYRVNRVPLNEVKMDGSQLEPFLSAQPSQKTVALSLYDTRFYSSIVYFPQILGIWISNGLNLPPLVVFWGGRIFALLFWLWVTWISLRILPTFKWVMMFFALTPTSLFIAASYSADGVTNAFSFLMIAVFLKAASPDWETIDLRRLFLLAAALVPVLFLKFPYITPIVLLFFIPFRKYARKRYFYFLLLAAIAGLAFWFVRVNLLSGATLIGPHEGTNGNPPAQLAFILSNPITYLEILANTVGAYLALYAITFVGIFGWFGPLIPFVFVGLYYVFLIALSLTDHRMDFTLPRGSRLVLLAALAAVFLEIFSTMYLAWTAVASPTVIGVQSRYFFPVAPLACLLFYNRRSAVSKKWLAAGTVASLLILLGVSTAVISSFYYM